MSGNAKEYDPQKFSLERHEYVWLKIDIHTTLSQEFSAQSLAGAEGTFPIASQAAQEKAWSLVDEFLKEIGFPVDASSQEEEGGKELPCPVFRPRHHLVLIDQIFRQYGVSVIVFPVHKASEAGSPRDDEAIFDRLIRDTLVPIVFADDTETPPNNPVYLCTTRKLQVEEEISQDVYNSGMFVVGSLTGIASDTLCLDSDSIDMFSRVAASTYNTFNDEYPKALGLGSQRRCRDRGHHGLRVL